MSEQLSKEVTKRSSIVISRGAREESAPFVPIVLETQARFATANALRDAAKAASDEQRISILEAASTQVQGLKDKAGGKKDLDIDQYLQALGDATAQVQDNTVRCVWLYALLVLRAVLKTSECMECRNGPFDPELCMDVAIACSTGCNPQGHGVCGCPYNCSTEEVRWHTQPDTFTRACSTRQQLGASQPSQSEGSAILVPWELGHRRSRPRR